MDLQKALSVLNKAKPGAYNILITYKTYLPLTKAAEKFGLDQKDWYKTTVRQCRCRIKYANMKDVKEKVANGYVLTHQPPKGMVWSTDPDENGLVLYKTDGSRAYLRLYKTPNKDKTEYVIGGIPGTYQDVVDIYNVNIPANIVATLPADAKDKKLLRSEAIRLPGDNKLFSIWVENLVDVRLTNEATDKEVQAMDQADKEVDAGLGESLIEDIEINI